MSFEISRKELHNHERSAQIIMTGVRVFIEIGYGRFSLRRVAKEMGMSLGNLQHFFKTKADLLAAMFEYVNSRYDEIHTSLLENLPDDPEDRLREYLQYLIADMRNKETNWLFFDFWALGARDADAASVMGRMYTAHRKRIEQLVKGVKPKLGEVKRKLIAAQIVAQTEGLMVLIHHQMPRHQELADIDNYIVSSLMQLVQSAKP